MHTRQGVAAPAQPNHSPAETTEKLRELPASNWAPLEKLCPPGLCEQFMFLGRINGIHLYEHADSHRYLYLDVLGATYAYNRATSSFDPIPAAAAMVALTPDLLDDLFAPSERAALMILFSMVQP
jgi:hypothetical protein